MGRRRKEALRALTAEERAGLEELGRATSAPAGVVARARALVAVAAGCSEAAAARRVGRRSGDAVAELAARFDRAGPAAGEPRHGGGPRAKDGAVERERSPAEARRGPERAVDRTAPRAVTTLRRAPRAAADGRPEVGTPPIRGVLHAADPSWRRDRAWGHTGPARRRRRPGEVDGHAPHATVQRGRSSGRTPGPRGRPGPGTRPGRTGRSRGPAPAGGRRPARPAPPTSTPATARPSR